MLTTDCSQSIARVNGVALHAATVRLTPEELRQRACTELLRQAAQASGRLSIADTPSTDGVIGEHAAIAIEALLEETLQVPDPSEEECRRHYLAHANSYQTGEMVHLRHILFAVTPGVDLGALRRRAEAALLEVRCHGDDAVDRFAAAARSLSGATPRSTRSVGCGPV